MKKLSAMEKKIEREIKKEIKKIHGKKIHTRKIHRRKMRGGLIEPTVNPSTGIEEIPVQDFAAYQQALIAGTPPANQVQDLSTVPYGEVASTVADLATEIPEIGPIIGLAKEGVNALFGIFYHPKATIEQRLRSEGIDIFQDNVILTNSNYPEDDPKHFVILLPNGMTADGKAQARYSALIYYMKVLGNNAATWINRISQAERDYLFPPNDLQWGQIFNGLAQTHGHANPYLVKAKFNK